MRKIVPIIAFIVMSLTFSFDVASAAKADRVLQANSLIPKNPIWSELGGTEVSQYYFLTNPTIRSEIDDNGKEMGYLIVKRVCRKTIRHKGQLVGRAGDFDYFLYVLFESDNIAGCIASQHYDAKGKMMTNLDSKFYISGAYSKTTNESNFTKISDSALLVDILYEHKY